MTFDETKLPPGKIGLLLHHAAFYDLTVGLMTLGHERAFRERLVALARLAPGDAVLDVGCGTGSLALAAKRHVGAAGAVSGIDASPEMLARAAAKARKAGLAIRFEQAAAQALPFPAAQFDAVLTTVMLHHLPRPGRELCAREMRRVLKPGGRVLAVEFAASTRPRGGFLSRLHRRHGHVKLDQIVALLAGVELTIVESGALGFRNLHFVLATAPANA